jgi:hypothetical protein
MLEGKNARMTNLLDLFGTVAAPVAPRRKKKELEAV